jgi:hypothetical protein
MPGIDQTQLLTHIIKPTLKGTKYLFPESPPWAGPKAHYLLLCTAAVESEMGKYIKQIKGPAIGIFQVEPATLMDDLGYLDKKIGAQDYLCDNSGFVRSGPLGRQLNRAIGILMKDLSFQTLMARVHYYRVPHKLPRVSDAEAMWRYYKVFYNSTLGKTTREKWDSALRRHKLL